MRKNEKGKKLSPGTKPPKSNTLPQIYIDLIESRVESLTNLIERQSKLIQGQSELINTALGKVKVTETGIILNIDTQKGEYSWN